TRRSWITRSSRTTRRSRSASRWSRRSSSGSALLGGLGEVLDALDGRVLRPAVVESLDQLLRELLRHVHACHHHAGHLAVLDRVVDAREGDGELVVGEADVREVGVDPREVLAVDLEIQLALRVLVHLRPRY